MGMLTKPLFLKVRKGARAPFRKLTFVARTFGFEVVAEPKVFGSISGARDDARSSPHFCAEDSRDGARKGARTISARARSPL
eukprot:1902988-Pyramimonas_sp.AAC.1